MGAEKVNYTEEQGDTIPYSFTFEDSDGNAIDISDWTIFATVKESIDDSDADAKIQKTVTSHDNPTSGETSLTYTSSDTDGLEGTYVYDFQYKDGDGEITTFQRGEIRFRKDVTESTS